MFGVFWDKIIDLFRGYDE